MWRAIPLRITPWRYHPIQQCLSTSVGISYAFGTLR